MIPRWSCCVCWQHGRCEHVWTRQATGSLGMQSVSAAHWKSLAYPTRPTRTPPCEAQEWLIWRARTKAMMLCPWSTPRLNRIPAAHVGWQRVCQVYKVKRSMLHINLWTPRPEPRTFFYMSFSDKAEKGSNSVAAAVNTFLTHRDPPAIWNHKDFPGSLGIRASPNLQPHCLRCSTCSHGATLKPCSSCRRCQRPRIPMSSWANKGMEAKRMASIVMNAYNRIN